MNRLLRRRFIWNDETCFLWKIKKMNVVCCLALSELTLCTLWAYSADDKLMIFFFLYFFFFKKIGFDISCKLSLFLVRHLAWNVKSYFLEEIRKTILKCRQLKIYNQHANLLPWSCWTRIYPAFANSVDPDQLASGEANWSGSALFAIKYVNL